LFVHLDLLPQHSSHGSVLARDDDLKKEKTHKRTPPTKPITPMTIPTVIIPPAFLQPVSITLGAVIPSLLQNVGNVVQRVNAGKSGRGAVGRHLNTLHGTSHEMKTWN
jgi:hypothetical protein